MKNATEWMALDDDAWESDAYGAWLYVSPGDDIELLVDDLNEALAGRHQLALEEVSETEPYRLHIDGAVHELSLDAKDRDTYDLLTLVIGTLQADTMFYMDRDDVGDDMHSLLLLPRVEAEAMQAAHPRAAEARLLPLSPGLELWQLVEGWWTEASSAPGDPARQTELDEAKAELKHAAEGLVRSDAWDKWRVAGRVFGAFRNGQLTLEGNWKNDPRAIQRLAELSRIDEPAKESTFMDGPTSPRSEDVARKTVSCVVRKDPWWKLW